MATTTRKPKSKARKPRMSDAEKAMKALAPIIAALESGDVDQWRKTWQTIGAGYQLRSNGQPYKGINQFTTAMAAAQNGWESPMWGTYDHWMEKGGAERVTMKFANGGSKRVWKGGEYSLKGAKGTTVVFAQSRIITEENPETGEEESRFAGNIYRVFTVFNADQVTGIKDAHRFPKGWTKPEARTSHDPIAAAEAIWNGWGDKPKTFHGFDVACYVKTTDTVRMPDMDQFDSAADYYRTKFHEGGHATGHEDRMNRRGVREATIFGSVQYGVEEVVAETCAAILSAHAGIDEETHRNGVAYLSSWMRAIKADPVQFLRMAGHGVNAAHYILGTEAMMTEDAAPDDALVAA
jgi:antirestriction protein ArdC